MDLSLLDTLKAKLIHTRNFTEVWEYFLDHFGEDFDFIALGDLVRDPFLEVVLAYVGKELFGRQISVSDLLLTRLPEHHFLHGGGKLDGRLANLLYFEDIRMGLLVVVLSYHPGETRLVRFSGQMLPADWKPSNN